MFNITMASGGGTKYVFMSGFESEEKAIETAEFYDWQFTDENGFQWDLDVEEYES